MSVNTWRSGHDIFSLICDSILSIFKNGQWKICISEDCRISNTPILAIFIFSLIFCKTHLIMIWSLYRKVHTRNWKTFLSEFKSKQLSKYRISSYSSLPRIVYAAKVLFGSAIQWLIQRSEFIEGESQNLRLGLYITLGIVQKI